MSQKLPEIQTDKKLPRFLDSSVNNIAPREPVLRRPRTNPVTETPYADQAIKRWKEKMMNNSQSSKSILNINISFKLIFL